MSNEYSVAWKIDGIDAKTPDVAAKRARQMMLNPRSTATIFEIEGREIDLDIDFPMWGSRMHPNEIAEIVACELDGDELLILIRQLMDELVRKNREA